MSGYIKHPILNSKIKQILAGGLSLGVHLLIVVTLVVQAEPEAEKPRTVVMVSMVETAKPAPKLPTEPEPKPKSRPKPQPKPEPKPNLEPEPQVQAEPEPEPVLEKEPEPVENTDTLASQDTQEEIELPQFQADYLQNPPPVYPRLSQRLKEQGEVLLRVRVGVDGEPLEISLQQSSGHARLDQAAQKAVTQWRFEPAQSNGKPVIAWVVVPFEFALGG